MLSKDYHLAISHALRIVRHLCPDVPTVTTSQVVHEKLVNALLMLIRTSDASEQQETS